MFYKLNVCSFAWLILLSFGCSADGRVPLRGKVMFSDGTLITEGKLTFVSSDPAVPSPIAEIQSDGSYEAYTDRPGDGVPPGTYNIGLSPLGYDFNAENPRPFDIKYSDPATSGFKVNVTGPTNHDITVPKSSKK